MSDPTKLRRTLSLPMMVLYGLGTTIGAGIYALVGEIASVAGYFAPVSFLLAAFLTGFTAFSFAELCARYPRAAGVSLYTKQAFKSDRFSTLIGLLVILAGLVSAAALMNGFVGYLHQFIDLDRNIAIIITTLLLTAIATWGIAESVTIAAIFTIIEIGGLLMIVVVSRDSLATLPERWPELIPSTNISDWRGIFLGSILSFYAFIGFEDMVEVAEEVKDVKRNLPRAILLTLFITTAIYILLMFTAVLSLTPEALAASNAPLAAIYQHHTGQNAILISGIGMIAIINGALIQIIMASRVLYGLSSRQQLPKILSQVNKTTQTPLVATILAAIIVLTLALLGRLASLAEATSVIVLVIFSIVNLALWKIKRSSPNPEDVKTYPIWIPITGFFISSGFVLSKAVHLLQ